MNLGDLLDSTSERLKIGKSDSLGLQRVTRYIDETYREIMSKKGIGKKLRQQTVAFYTVADSPIAALPQATHRISNDIVDRVNGRVYTPLSLSEIRQRDPRMAYSTSAPYGYTVLGMADAVSIDPAMSTEVYVVSDSAVDTGGTNAHIEGITSDGQSRRATVTLAGLSPISLDESIITWTLITKFYITSRCQGSVTLHNGSNHVELARIAPGHSFARYTRLLIYPTPTTILTLYADVELQLTPLISTYDEPLIDEDFQWLIVSGSLLKEYLRNSKMSEYDRELPRWNRGISDLRSHIQAPLGGGMTRQSREWSQLGPNFPAGT